MIYYRRYIGSYVKRTARLSMREHGAYCLMLDFYYAEEEPLPLEREDIYDICKARTPEDCKSVDKVLRLFFEKHDDGYHNDRADAELSASQQARTNGKKGGRPRTGGITEHETGEGTESEPGTEPDAEPEHEPDYKPEGEPTQTGSVHPTTYNHLAVQPSSLQPTTDSRQPGAKPVTRAVAVAVLLRDLEKARGKVSKITSTHPKVQDWAQSPITDAQLVEAHSMAAADRDTQGDPSPISAGFLDIFVQKILHPPAAKPNGNGSGHHHPTSDQHDDLCDELVGGVRCTQPWTLGKGGKRYCRAHDPF